MTFSTGAAHAQRPVEAARRIEGFVGAARTLATDTGSSAFTVQQVVERAGQSRKSFYKLFTGKDDLLVALLRDDCALGAGVLSALVDAHDTPTERVRAWVTGLFGLMASGDQGYVGVLVREHARLSETRPDELGRAVRPFLDLLVDELTAAQRAGAARDGDPATAASLVFALVLDRIRELVTGRGERSPADVADQVFTFCWRGLSA